MLRKLSRAVIVLSAGCLLLRAQDAPAPAARPTQSGTAATAELKPVVTPILPDARQIMQRAVAKDIISWQAAKDYTFLQRTQEDALEGNGAVKSSKSETSAIMVLYGEPFERIIAKDDKPLPEKEQKKQNEEFEKETRKRENESPEERQKRLEKFEKQRQDERVFVREILDAYEFTLVGREVLNGRETWIIDGTPRPG